MNRPDGRIEKGQRLTSAISARAWNRAQDAADVVLGVTPGTMAGETVPVEKASNIVLVRNDSLVPVPMLGVLAIDGIVISPANGALDGEGAASDKAREFARRPVLIGAKPVATTGGSFGIALEPIAANAIGRLALDGIVQSRLEITSAADRWANVKPDSVQELKTSSGGHARILWKESGTGSGKWGVLLMGTSGGVRLGKITANWAKGTTATVSEHDGDGTPIANETFSAINRFATVVVDTPKWVACASVGDKWHLIAAECG